METSEGRAIINWIKDRLKARRFKKTVDQIGNLRARIARLKAKGKDLEGFLYQYGAYVIEGHAFIATIVPAERNITDWKKIAIDLGASKKKIAKNTRTFDVVAVRITSRHGKVVNKS